MFSSSCRKSFWNTISSAIMYHVTQLAVFSSSFVEALSYHERSDFAVRVLSRVRKRKHQCLSSIQYFYCSSTVVVVEQAADSIP